MNSVAIGAESGLTVDMKTLDDILSGIEHVRLLKVDVEGFELAVFRSASKVLERTDFVYFESWEQHAARYNYTTPDLIDQVKVAGFSVYRIEAAGVEPVHAKYSSIKCENLLAVSNRCVDKEVILKSINVAI